jgi:hypothetical protein
MSEITTTKKMPLDWAATQLTMLCDIVDNGGDLSDSMVTLFGETKTALADATDRRILFWNYCENQIDHAKEMQKEWAERKQRLDAILTLFKNKTAAIIEENENLPFEGRHGHLRIQNNPPSLKLAFDVQDVTARSVVSLSQVETFKIDPKYLARMELFTVVKDAVKKDLLNGAELTWAKIEQGKSLRRGK